MPNVLTTDTKWWRAVFRLLRIADETCAGVGHVRFNNPDDAPFTHDYAETLFRIARSKDTPLTGSLEGFSKMGQGVSTYAATADATVITVHPKSRVSALGCTLRNFSRNLAATGSSGQVRCSWQQVGGKPKAEEDEGLDILVVPLPYEIPAKFFRPTNRSRSGNTGARDNHRWGNFTLDQKWLPKSSDKKGMRQFLKNIENLIILAREDVNSVNAVVFPEYALDFETFHAIADHVAKIEPDIEFIIAGSSSNCDDEKCNCVLTAIWEEPTTKNRGQRAPSVNKASRITSQRKHHRWRLERSQLETYTLSSTLHPDREWWEEHEINRREMNFFQFRQDSVFCSIICEDLARNDPVHGIIRSVAPNLVVALLMDGAQIPQRWSARYASTLADDPGSSVLTLTSFGLIRRANENRHSISSNSIGLWKDETGGLVEVKLPSEASGVLISLTAIEKRDVTIDGRTTDTARSWCFSGQKPLFV